jgi:hypothetical protein
MLLDLTLRLMICTYYAFVDSPPMPTGTVTDKVFPALNAAVVIL